MQQFVFFKNSLKNLCIRYDTLVIKELTVVK